jgi:hypothetical protein
MKFSLQNLLIPMSNPEIETHTYKKKTKKTFKKRLRKKGSKLLKLINPNLILDPVIKDY